MDMLVLLVSLMPEILWPTVRTVIVFQRGPEKKLKTLWLQVKLLNFMTLAANESKLLDVNVGNFSKKVHAKTRQ